MLTNLEHDLKGIHLRAYSSRINGEHWIKEKHSNYSKIKKSHGLRGSFLWTFKNFILCIYLLPFWILLIMRHMIWLVFLNLSIMLKLFIIFHNWVIIKKGKNVGFNILMMSILLICLNLIDYIFTKRKCHVQLFSFLSYWNYSSLDI